MECECHIKNLSNRLESTCAEAEKQFNLKRDLLDFFEVEKQFDLRHDLLDLLWLQKDLINHVLNWIVFPLMHKYTLVYYWNFFSNVDSSIHIGKDTLLAVQYYIII